jgi:ABC-type phosphate transport system substrate-binding protein
MYNLHDSVGNQITNLRLTRRAACQIFTGAITRWNDPALVASNPWLSNFPGSIRPVTHADPSGANYTMSQFCIAVAPDIWSTFVQAQKDGGNAGNDSPEFLNGLPTWSWPELGWNNVPVAYDDGVANFIADAASGPGTIGFVAAGYAQVRNFTEASLENASGAFVAPESGAATAGVADGSVTAEGWFTPNLTDPNPAAYQPVEFATVIAQTVGFDAAKGSTLARFLCYAVTGGQDIAPQIRYARISPAVKAVALAAIGHIPGAPDATMCAAGTPSAPAVVHATVHASQVDITWAPANGHGLPITGYQLTWGALTSSSFSITSRMFAGPGTHASLTLAPGSYTFSVAARTAVGMGAGSIASNTVWVAPATGYWMLGTDGHVYAFGSATRLGSSTGFAVAIAARRDGTGYWITDAAGNVSHFGTATALGAPPHLRPGERVSTISDTPSGHGYWLFTNLGRAFQYGDAHFYGDMSAVALRGAIVASVATPSGHGYYMVGSDGGVFSFGDARFHGSTGDTHLNRPIVGVAPAPNNRGYWLVASDGGVFAFDAQFRGSLGGKRLNEPVKGLVAYRDGYLMVAADGGVFDFSDTAFLGSLANTPPSSPIVGITAFST